MYILAITPMALSWNEITERAIKFSEEWQGVTTEDAEAKPFLTDFFNIFGINRRRVATFEEAVKIRPDKAGYIDLFWPGQLIVEMKSAGKDLDRAYKQALEYTQGLKQYDLPKYILVCDFIRFRLYDLEEGTHSEFTLPNLYQHIKEFAFIAGYQKKQIREEDPVNIRAAELMGKLHDELKALGYSGHQLEMYLVRILFCLFADDTTIFEKDTFHDYIKNKTKEDGSDIGNYVAQLFQVLNTPESVRMKSLDEDLAHFPFVNGKLFEEMLPIASWNSKMRNALLECCDLNWGLISPAIFGSLFQSVMDEKARRNLGAHYTSERNILKLIKPLFLDDLHERFEKVKRDKKKLQDLHKEISQLKFLDPACGCGNFLVITYRELRLLELEILKVLQQGQQVTQIGHLVRIDVDQFYGIEYEEFPAQIAQVAMWLIDHQMNLVASEAFGAYFKRIPLKKSPTIVHGNALRIDWQSLFNQNSTLTIHANETNLLVQEPSVHYDKINVVTKKVNKVASADELAELKDNEDNYFNYVLGNPPFIGKKEQTSNQKGDLNFIWQDISGVGVLDYVSCWYLLAAKYFKAHNSEERKIRCAFVSTNSICQGEQVGVLWSNLLSAYKIKIHFAHQTFKWSNEGKGNAGVHCVIIGFSNFDIEDKQLFEYKSITSNAEVSVVKNINPYLVGGNDIVLHKRSIPICQVKPINYGSIGIDNGFLMLSEAEVKELITLEPAAKKYIRRYIGGDEFINNINRFCLWLLDIQPNELRQINGIRRRVAQVKEFREKSLREATRKLALTPSLFGEIRQPKKKYVIIPKVSSENRTYIPIGFLSPNIIANGSALCISNASLFEFGVITSIMHMAWMKYTCGRLESRFQYSTSIVYNNYPWPENPADKQIKAVELAAQNVLDTRNQFAESSLADLYDPVTMPPELVKAHSDLDKAVDLCYRPQPFVSETKRIEYLFELYDKYTSGLFASEKKSKKKASKAK